jgi:membrane glycosyltransferase
VTEHCPAELNLVERGGPELATGWNFPHGGIARAVIDPLMPSVHVALFRQRKAGTEEREGYLERLRRKLIEEGPDALQASQHFALLWNAESLRWLHHEFWSRSASRLHPWWRERLEEIVERIGLAR